MSSIDNTPHAIYSNSSVTDLIDVKDAGSCNIITDDERNTILTNAKDIKATVKALNYNYSTQIGLDIDGEAAGDNSGYSVSLSLDGSVVAIGGFLNEGNNAYRSGHVRVYEWDGSAWSQKGLDIDGEAADDRSGGSVSLSSDGSVVAIGSTNNDGNGSNSGHVRVYEWDGDVGEWSQIGSDIDVDGEAAGDSSGYSVSLSSDGSVLAIGAINNNGNGDKSGHVRIYKVDTQIEKNKRDIATKAPLESPQLTGIPTAPTADISTNTTQLATTEFVNTQISNLIDSAPDTLDTLKEIADAINNDSSFAVTINNSIATNKADIATNKDKLNKIIAFFTLNFFGPGWMESIP